ncbi:hypothetical protein KFE25_005389 [Diacronema lutheri]|uniref:RING-type domain-containing protein n=1 Tax=Diacronema lutheri TaxID=2081491 RepID=A0A8J6CAS5_DIALT|nr:hypothetical protein KFE25_005389 [Diacronema lutheri]
MHGARVPPLHAAAHPPLGLPVRTPPRAAAAHIHATVAERRVAAAAAAHQPAAASGPPAAAPPERRAPVSVLPLAALAPHPIIHARAFAALQPPLAPARASSVQPGPVGLARAGRPTSGADRERRQAELERARLSGQRRLQLADERRAALHHAASVAAAEHRADELYPATPLPSGSPRASSLAERAAAAALERAHVAARAAAEGASTSPAVRAAEPVAAARRGIAMHAADRPAAIAGPARPAAPAEVADAERVSHALRRAADVAQLRAALERDDDRRERGARADAQPRESTEAGGARLALVRAREHALLAMHCEMVRAAMHARDEEEDAQIELAIALSRSIADAAPGGHAAVRRGDGGALDADAQGDMSYERLSALEDVHVGVPPEVVQRVCPQMAFEDAAEFRAAAALNDMGDAGACAICLCEFEADDGVRLLPECMHVYHAGCIDSWLRRSKQCPTCKVELCE